MRHSYLRIIGSFVFMLFIPISAISAAEGTPPNQRFSLVIREGFGSLGVGDMNTTISSINTAYDQSRESYPEYITGSIPEASNGFKDWEVEVRWGAWKGLSFGVALSGPIHLNSHGCISYVRSWTQALLIESEARMAAPIKLNLYYSFPIHSKFNLVLNGGVGLYHARMSQSYDWQRRYSSDESGYGADVNVVGNYNFNVSGRTTGYHCGVGLEYKFNDRFSMMAEGQWRFAKIHSLEGTGNRTTRLSYVSGGDIISSTSDSQEGYLYHYIYDLYGYEELEVFENPDDVSGISEVRKATLDLGGFTFKIGLKIGLF